MSNGGMILLGLALLIFMLIAASVRDRAEFQCRIAALEQGVEIEWQQPSLVDQLTFRAPCPDSVVLDE